MHSRYRCAGAEALRADDCRGFRQTASGHSSWHNHLLGRAGLALAGHRRRAGSDAEEDHRAVATALRQLEQ
eukprot:91298-Pyramimonas_sp.AAC.1